MARGYGVGASLVDFGQDQEREATQMLRQSAEDETRRNIQNKQLEAQEKQGRQQLASSVGSAAGFALGAQTGSIGGPWGALIGGAIGYLAGGWGGR